MNADHSTTGGWGWLLLPGSIRAQGPVGLVAEWRCQESNLGYGSPPSAG